MLLDTVVTKSICIVFVDHRQKIRQAIFKFSNRTFKLSFYLLLISRIYFCKLLDTSIIIRYWIVRKISQIAYF